MQNVVIVGAGISGLSLAYRLEQLRPDLQVTVLERRERVGGTIGTIEKHGFRVETGPNGFLDNNPSTLQLCKDLGLEDRLISASEESRKHRYLFLNGKLQILPTSLMSFLTSPLLSFRSKLAFMTERFRSARKSHTDESIDSFARRRSNDEIASTLVDAFVTGVHAGDPRLLSIHAAFPRMAALEREHGSITRGMAQTAKQRREEAAVKGEEPRRGLRTWSFQEGLTVLPETISQCLRRQPIVGVGIRRLARSESSNHWIICGNGKNQWQADAVILACPAYQQATLLADVNEQMAATVADIPYNRVAVVALGYRREDVKHPMVGFGYLTPGRQKRDCMGAQWCSSIFPGRAPDGAVLLRAMCGGWHRPEMVGWPDEQLLAAVRTELQQVMGICAEPVFHHLTRWDRAIPQYHLGHLDRVANIERQVQQHPGLFLTGNAYQGVALNDCTTQATLMSERVSRYLNNSRG